MPSCLFVYPTADERDASAGLVYLSDGHSYGRPYDPALGRFVQPDTIVPQPGNPQSLNRYAYGYNNPLRFTDPTGHCGAAAITLERDFVCEGGIGIPAALVVDAGKAAATAGTLLYLTEDKLPAVGDRLSQVGGEARRRMQAARQGGQTGSPGGMDPNDPWRWGTNYRANYEQYYGVTRDPNYQVHHVLPQQWRDVLARANINVDDPRWLREVVKEDPTTGVRIHQRLYTEVWEQWAQGLGRTPTAQEIIQYAKQLEDQYAIEGTLFYREGANLPGRVDWEALLKLLQGGP